MQDKVNLVTAPHIQLARQGETLAVKYLKNIGYRIVMLNFQTRLGRSLSGQSLRGEIDIVAYERDLLCFIEVKTRRSTTFASPQEAVDKHKQRQLSRTAYRYRQIFNLLNQPYRFDVVAIVWPVLAQPTINLYRAFFTPSLGKKRAYCWQREGIY